MKIAKLIIFVTKFKTNLNKNIFINIALFLAIKKILASKTKLEIVLLKET